MSTDDSKEILVTIFDKFNEKADLGIVENFDKVDVDLLKALLKLIGDRRSTSGTTDEEYLEQKLQTVGEYHSEHEEGQKNDNTMKDILFRMYLSFRKHETVMGQIVADYIGNRKLSIKSLDTTRVIALILTVYMDNLSIEEVKDVLLKFNPLLTKKLVEFLSSYDLEKTMYRYFDREYVNEILRVKATEEIIQKMHAEMTRESVESNDSKIQKLFVSKPFKTHYVKQVKQPDPTNDKESYQDFTFKARPVPYDILHLNLEERDRQREEKMKRRKMEARKLRDEANKKLFRAAERIGIKKETHVDEPKETHKANRIKARKVHQFPPVAIKTNATQTLREAANIRREEEKFEKMIICLTNGSLGNFEYENYIEELRKQKEIEDLENIERRKLQALITHEEAILAKKRLIEKNKCEKQEFRRQWEEYETKMNEMREKEMLELKLLSYVETKQREMNIQEKMKNMLDEKSRLVKEEQEKMKEDQERKMRELTEDIERKKELVRSIKLLQEIARLNNECRVKFDETEVINNGFMYEMSLAELKARLSNMELEMKEDLERKKCEIIHERQKKQKLLEDTSKLIEDNRIAKREMRRVQEEMKNLCVQKPSVHANMDLKLKLIQIRQERLSLKN